MFPINLMLNETEYNQLLEISEELRTQDNLHTTDPAYIVYDLNPIPVDGDCSYSNNSNEFQHNWAEYKVDDETYIHEDEIEEYIEEYNAENPDEPLDIDELETVTMCYVDKFIGCFLTRKAAQEHIDTNSYHYHKPYIFVESYWRNYEMQTVRNVLLKLDEVIVEPEKPDTMASLNELGGLGSLLQTITSNHPNEEYQTLAGLLFHYVDAKLSGDTKRSEMVFETLTKSE